MIDQPLYPDVSVQLVGMDGNAFSIIASVSVALREAGHGAVVRDFRTEATSGDYDHLLRTCMKYVDVK